MQLPHSVQLLEGLQLLPQLRSKNGRWRQWLNAYIANTHIRCKITTENITAFVVVLKVIISCILSPLHLTAVSAERQKRRTDNG